MYKRFLQQFFQMLSLGLTLPALLFMPAISHAMGQISQEGCSNKELNLEAIKPENDSIERIQKTASSREEEIQRLEKLKEYYESNIRRLSRTAWRLEFKDPGYSRILDQRVAQLQKKLDAVNKRLNELQ